MKNLRRLALVAGVAALSAIAFSPKAQAQTANVDFSGSIGPACIINSVTNGTLVPVGTQILAANSAFGTPGNINVTCTNGTTFTITGITDNGSSLTTGTYATGISLIAAQILDVGAGGTDPLGNPMDLTVAIAQVSPDGNNGIGFPVGVAGPLQAAAITNKNYPVNLNLTKNGVNLSSGFYKVRVGVALTPQ
ncbi:hypothetical protein FJR11_06100 [Anabaena sp. UHCC 0187]|uniref:hypothetical protein n=1 Tax=Anabaena sp. UHCC 0187 TaxID=2590018 RepID=UPI0014467311|nr:hypothetical protein [Anabaena sp. UHCC 0187]MTJ12173.1 hypothetical protein [Anabaena sp. UHCC 0187]